MITRLALMVFLQNAVNGALVPMFSVRLTEMGFTAWQIGVCSATTGLVGMASPFMGQVADRWISPNRCLAVCGFWCATVMALMPLATDYPLMLGLSLLYWLGSMPMSLMSSSIAFSHLKKPEKDFGRVRVWGTIGWMTPPWIMILFQYFVGGDSHTSLKPFLFLGSGMALFLGFYSFTLPPTPPRSHDVAKVAPLAALARVRGTTFYCYILAIFGWCLVHPFNVQGTPLMLKDLLLETGGTDAVQWVAPILTLAQMNEVGTMLLFPLVLRAVGTRGSMAIGLGAWLATLLMLSAGKPLGLVIGSLLLNGLVITNFLMAGQIYLNGEVTGDLKTSVQSLFFTVQGFGLMLGHLLFGGLRAAIPEGDFDSDLPTVFLIGSSITGLIYLIFLMGFRPGKDNLQKA